MDRLRRDPFGWILVVLLALETLLAVIDDDWPQAIFWLLCFHESGRRLR